MNIWVTLIVVGMLAALGMLLFALVKSLKHAGAEQVG
jgi:hypothetical protein